MENRKRKHSKDFKIMISELLISGQSARVVAADYDLNENLIRKWRKQYESEREAFTGSGRPSLTPEEKRIKSLEKKLKDVSMERDILKKAIGIFSKKDS